MPTGHTYPVVEGKITTLNEFAYECSKSFVWSFREGDRLAYPPKRDSYYVKRLPEAMAELTKWDAMTEAEKYAAWSDMADEMSKYAAESKAKAEETAARIRPLLAAARNVVLPETHKRFKEFMIQQLTETLEWDGTYKSDYHVIPSYSEWCDAKRPRLLKDIAYYAEELAKTDKNYAEGRAWIDVLAQTFGLTVHDAY